ncbi:S12A6-like protein [Mya arenaria]|uniref:S12A6-like protein n=1 Tax=Mya arenaria TaxID=6604 RepID=A0ABY7ENV9_MYAAR|nr:S12A6-like protein [Mya arenaria]
MMVRRFSVEEVPEKDNIPLEPLCPVEENNHHENGEGGEGPAPCDPLLTNGGPAPESPKKLPTITITTDNGDHVITRIKSDHDFDKGAMLGEDGGSRLADQEPFAVADELTSSDYSNQMALYEDDIHHQGRISTLLNRLANYHAGIEPNTSEKKKTQAKNIFGVLLFIRMTWIVGMAGALEGFFIVFVCCSCTMLTAISMSAIATNGVVPAGGSYFMISRALGPEFGGAVGVLFYLGTTVASSMYIIGAIEILVTYMNRSFSIFGDVGDQSNALNNYRVYGTAVLLLLGVIVFIGVAFVSKFATLSLACVILSIFSIYIGIFVANQDNSVVLCYLGDRLLTSASVTLDGEMMCIKNETAPIYHKYCHLVGNETECDPYFTANEMYTKSGIPGLASGVFNSIMAGSNRSGDLEDAQKSIPVGTIAAIVTTNITCTLFFAGTIEGDLLRDKLGESINGGLVIAYLAWPTRWVILIGSFLSTVGAGLQSLTGAPRLLQAIAMDGVIPVLNFFSVTTKRGEPFRALLLTLAISEIGILIANLDLVAPVITMTLSLLGLALCVCLMFISSWYYALTAIAVAVCIYNAEKEWGDGIRGLAMSAARYSLLRAKYPKMVEFATQLKAGKGLTLVTSVLEGKWKERYADAQAARQNLQKVIDSTGVKGFADVIVSESVTDTINNVGAGQMALLVIKGTNTFPSSHEKLKGTIDIWWIVHDGGLLMLLPFLLKQHKTWRNCNLRIFTVAQMLKNMRIGKMPQPQTIVDRSHEAATAVNDVKDRNQFTFTPNFRNQGVSIAHMASTINKNLLEIKPDQKNVRRMHTAVRLNEVIIQKSHEAKLVILNLPAPPKHEAGELNYMEFLEVLTEGLDNVLMVRGSGSEVITIYS